MPNAEQAVAQRLEYDEKVKGRFSWVQRRWEVLGAELYSSGSQQKPTDFINHW